MCIEQIIKFGLRGPGPSGRTCNPKTVIFGTKQSSSKQIFKRNITYC